MSKLSLFERFYVFVDGVYSLVIVCVVLAILVVTNIFASALPETLTKYDISAVKLYSVTSNTKAVVNGPLRGRDHLLGGAVRRGGRRH